MNLVKDQICIDLEKCKTSTQLTLDMDVNLAETMPDLDHIILDKPLLLFDEVKAMENQVLIRGKLKVDILYAALDERQKICKLKGEIPFEEMVYAEQVTEGDFVEVKSQIEDLSMRVVNSRKVSMKSIVTLCLQIVEIMEEEVATDVELPQNLQYRSQKFDISKLAVQKEDSVILQQEFSIPGALPNIYNVIWGELELSSVEFKTLEDKLMLTGDLNVFVLYENELQDDNVSFYETTIPISQELACQGSSELMIADISIQRGEDKLAVEEDEDGEMRLLRAAVSLKLGIKLYQDEQLCLLSDAYGTKNEICIQEKELSLQKILYKNCAKKRMKESIELQGEKQILQLIHSQGSACLEEVSVTKEGALVSGVLTISCLYVTSDDAMPYAFIEKKIPFQHLLEAKNVKEGCTVEAKVSTLQLTITMTDVTHLEAAFLLEICGIFFEKKKQSVILSLEEKPFEKEKWKALPMVAIYVVEPGDSLWKIGRSYYVTVDRIKQLNGLSGDEIYPGQKLLIVKEMS